MSETSNEWTGPTLLDLMCYVEDTPANHSAALAEDWGNKIPDICGLGFEKPLANYDPATRSWKMYGDTCLWGPLPCLEILPPSGTTQNGELFLRPPWAPTIAAIGSSSWPTPQARDHKGASGRSTKRGIAMDLPYAVGGSPNPTWVEWLMGFPTGWTDLEASETQ